MSQDNVEAVRRGLDALNRRDRAAWLTLCDPELEAHPSSEFPESAPVHGAEAVWDFIVDVAETFDGAEFEWGELIDAGREKIVANQRADTRGKTSGASVVWSYWVVGTVRGGKVSRLEWFPDRAEALEAAALSE